MSATGDLTALLKQVPRDAQGAFKDSPEKIAFIDALATAKPLNPPQLLAMAASLRSDPNQAHQADTLALEALRAIAHDRDCRMILSKIGGEATPWGVTVNQLRAQIIRAYHAPGQPTKRWRELSGASTKVKAAEGETLYFAPAQSGTPSYDTVFAARVVHGSLYVTSD